MLAQANANYPLRMSDDPPGRTTAMNTFERVESVVVRVSSIEQGASELAEVIRVPLVDGGSASTASLRFT
jgi:hypothetical protein